MKLIRFFKQAAAALVCGSLLVHASSSNDSDSSDEQFCPETYDKGVLSLGFNVAFLAVEEFDDNGDKTDGLTITSFFNPPGSGEVDKVALIRDLDDLDFEDFDPEVDVEELTRGSPGTVWPNEAVRAPDGVFPFEAVVIAQGFHPAPFPGRLTAVDVKTKTEYIITQSTEDPPFEPFDPLDMPRFYHKVLFIDMDGDGHKDIVTVHSGFRVIPPFPPYPPVGQLVWFRNPGDDLDANTEWEEVLLFGGPSASFLGPDIDLVAYDFENDGVPEIVATHFFSAFPAMPGGPPPSNGKIAIYGAPTGGSWADVDTNTNPVRKQDISVDQGFPFRMEVVDLNRDGKVDLLATNHQPDGCVFSSVVPGRVYALEQPVSGDIFNDTWTTRIILDNIRPQPSIRPNPPGRLAPGAALTFFPKLPKDPDQTRPWIVVGGDQAGKVWILKPVCYDCLSSDEWSYQAAVVFDINDFYGPDSTQTPFPNTTVAISTIGLVAINYDKKGFAELYIPVFEAQDIHVITFNKGKKRNHGKKGKHGKSGKHGKERELWKKKKHGKRMSRNCPADVNVACPQ